MRTVDLMSTAGSAGNRDCLRVECKSKSQLNMRNNDQASLGDSRHRSLYTPTSNSGTNELDKDDQLARAKPRDWDVVQRKVVDDATGKSSD